MTLRDLTAPLTFESGVDPPQSHPRRGGIKPGSGLTKPTGDMTHRLCMNWKLWLFHATPNSPGRTMRNVLMAARREMFRDHIVKAIFFDSNLL